MKSKILFVAALMLVCFTLVASAQVTWNTTYNNYQVVKGGRTELMGSVTFTSALPGQTTASPASAIQIDYQLPIGNLEAAAPSGPVTTGNSSVWTWPHGITLTVKGAALSVAAGWNVTPLGENALLIKLPDGIAVDQYDQIKLDGVRCDVSALDIHMNVQAIISSVPSDANNYNPNVVTVATVYDNFLLKNVTWGIIAACEGGTSRDWQFDIKEGFSGAFADYTGVNARTKAYGSTANTTFTFTAVDLPAGVSIDWPSEAASATTESMLSWVRTFNSGKSAEYEMVAGADGLADATVETFHFDIPVSGDVSKLTIGVGTFTATMGPVYDPDVDYIDQIISFSIEPQTGNLVQTVKCVTNLLFPYVVEGFGGYDTGLAVANTSFDTGAIATGEGANPQNGTITFFMYSKLQEGQTKSGPPLTFATPEVKAGDTYAQVLSALMPAAASDFQGYVIAVCNFQFAHGYAYVAYNMGQANGVVQGYVANVMPDFNSTEGSRQELTDDSWRHAESLSH
jgi:hypothetical protein